MIAQRAAKRNAGLLAIENFESASADDTALRMAKPAVSRCERKQVLHFVQDDKQEKMRFSAGRG